MTIKITYTDSVTGEVLGEDTVGNEEIKALGTDMISSNPKVVFSDWHRNAIHNKARQMIDKVCEDALNDQTDTILTKAEKKLIVAELAKTGRIISTVKQMPEGIKREIVKRANIQSAAERNAESEKP